MNFDKLFEEFIDEIQGEGTYASSDEVRIATKEMLDVIKNNKDATPDELVELIIKDNLEQIENIKKKYNIPGYIVNINIDNINVKFMGGNIDYNGRKMSDDALFDLASITKFYTQVVLYNLINEGYFSFDDKIKELDPRFINLGNITIRDISEFNVKFQTDGRLDSKSSFDDVYNTLYNVNVVDKGSYNYNDIGMMIIKEIMESVTGLSYEELIYKYIVSKYGLSNTHITIPKDKIINATGSANAQIGMVNDPNAIALGSFSGHAGVFASNDDLIKLGKAFREDLIPNNMKSRAYTPGLSDYRGIMGNSYTSHDMGIDKSYVDRLEPKSNFALQGSTKTLLHIGNNSICSILFNPVSMDIDTFKDMERKLNERLISQGKSPVSLIKYLSFNNGDIYKSFDVRNIIIPGSDSIEPIATSNAILTLRLRFLNKVINALDNTYNKEININKSL